MFIFIVRDKVVEVYLIKIHVLMHIGNDSVSQPRIRVNTTRERGGKAIDIKCWSRMKNSAALFG